MARITNAALLARIAALEAQLTSAPAAESTASAHYKARDIACSAAKPCDKTFRTTKGRDWHVANVTHPVKA